jgi:hypothetical protein
MQLVVSSGLGLLFRRSSAIGAALAREAMLPRWFALEDSRRGVPLGYVSDRPKERK